MEVQHVFFKKPNISINEAALMISDILPNFGPNSIPLVCTLAH